MVSPIADGVMAATHKLVQQAMSGQWHEVPKTIEERRLLLDQLSATASSQDQQWLGALKQAIAESDAAVAKITQAGAASKSAAGLETAAKQAHNTAAPPAANDLSARAVSTLDWLTGR
jgi:hypothetical protein